MQLPDEYDQIYHDLQPHRALCVFVHFAAVVQCRLLCKCADVLATTKSREPQDSRHRNRVMQDRDHTFTMGLRAGISQPELYGPHGGLKRATDVASLFAMFGNKLPREVNLTFIIDDNPAIMLPYAQRDRMVELAEQGECESFACLPLFITHKCCSAFRLWSFRIHRRRRRRFVKFCSSVLQ